MPSLRRTIPLLAVALTACSTPRPDDREVGARFRELSGDVTSRLTAESSMVTHHVDAPVARVWAILPEVFEDLEIPLGAFEPENMALGNREFSPKRIGGDRMSRYLDCGSGITGRPYADAYRVTLYLMTRIDALGPAQTRIRTEIDASARNREISGYPIHCTSKGILERRISERVSEMLGG
jgi:hypothetical protein